MYSFFLQNSDTGLILIAEVKSITKKYQNLMEDTNEITIELPRYLIGFEDQDLKLKSFII